MTLCFALLCEKGTVAVLAADSLAIDDLNKKLEERKIIQEKTEVK